MPETIEAKSPNIPARQLVLHTMLSLLVSVAVFVVVSWMVIVPQLARQEMRIRALESQVADLQEAQEEAEENVHQACFRCATSAGVSPA